MVSEPLDPLHARLCDAALRCIARLGIAKTTVDDVAREAGVSRATLYRTFSGKQPLLEAVVAGELDRIGAALVAAAGGCSDLVDAMTALVVTAARELSELPALGTVLAHEPEVLLPFLNFEAGDAAIARGGALCALALERWLDTDTAMRAGEWLTRIVLSYGCDPAEHLLLTDPDSVRLLVADFVAPAYAPTLLA